MIQPTLIYLAGPQDDVTVEVARGWREELAALAGEGVAFFSPAHAYMNVNRASFPAVDWVNRKVIEASHAVIANLSGPGRGFGTIREIEYAMQVHTMVQVIGSLDHALMTWDITVVETAAEALDNVLKAVVDARENMKRFHPVLGIQIHPPPEEQE